MPPTARGRRCTRPVDRSLAAARLDSFDVDDYDVEYAGAEPSSSQLREGTETAEDEKWPGLADSGDDTQRALDELARVVDGVDAIEHAPSQRSTERASVRTSERASGRASGRASASERTSRESAAEHVYLAMAPRRLVTSLQVDDTPEGSASVEEVRRFSRKSLRI